LCKKGFFISKLVKNGKKWCKNGPKFSKIGQKSRKKPEKALKTHRYSGLASLGAKTAPAAGPPTAMKKAT
jgi:hypothetical protein